MGNKSMFESNRSQINQLEDKFNLARRNPNYSFLVSNRLDSSLREISDARAWYLSSPSARDTIAEETGYSTPSTLKEVSNEGLQRAYSAWGYLRGAVKLSSKPTDQVLSIGVLEGLAGQIEPINISLRDNASSAVLYGGEYTAPNGFKLRELVESSLNVLRTESAYPVDKAIYAFLSIISLQPFSRGNKRLGKLVRNSILYDHGFIPAVVPLEARKKHDLLIKEYLLESNGKKKEAQRRIYNLFYDLLAKEANSIRN
jgi:Fic family protein